MIAAVNGPAVGGHRGLLPCLRSERNSRGALGDFRITGFHRRLEVLTHGGIQVAFRAQEFSSEHPVHDICISRFGFAARRLGHRWFLHSRFVRHGR